MLWVQLFASYSSSRMFQLIALLSLKFLKSIFSTKWEQYDSYALLKGLSLYYELPVLILYFSSIVFTRFVDVWWRQECCSRSQWNLLWRKKLLLLSLICFTIKRGVSKIIHEAKSIILYKIIINHVWLFVQFNDCSYKHQEINKEKCLLFQCQSYNKFLYSSHALFTVGIHR
jgi:hypothetical protein